MKIRHKKWAWTLALRMGSWTQNHLVKLSLDTCGVYLVTCGRMVLDNYGLRHSSPNCRRCSPTLVTLKSECLRPSQAEIAFLRGYKSAVLDEQIASTNALTVSNSCKSMCFSILRGDYMPEGGEIPVARQTLENLSLQSALLLH